MSKAATTWRHQCQATFLDAARVPASLRRRVRHALPPEVEEAVRRVVHNRVRAQDEVRRRARRAQTAARRRNRA